MRLNFRANGLYPCNIIIFNYLSGLVVSVSIKAAMLMGLMIAAALYQDKIVLEIASLIKAI